MIVFLLLTAGAGLGVLLLWATNLPQEDRFRQVWSPGLALALLVAVAVLYPLLLDPLASTLSGLVAELESLFGWDGRLTEIVAGVVNVSLLFVFGLVKALGTVGQRFFGRPREPWIAYEIDRDDGALLLPKWVYPRFLARHMAVLAGILLVLFLFSQTVYDPLASVADQYGIAGIPWPRLLVVPFLVFAEVAWYLGGRRTVQETGEDRPEELEDEEQGTFDDLYDRYLERWPDKVLARSRSLGHGGEDQLRPPRASTLEEARPELEAAWKDLRSREDIDHLDSTYFALFQSLWADEDVLVEDPMVERLEPVLFAALQRELLSGDHLLVLTASAADRGEEDESEPPYARRLVEWIRAGLEDLYGHGAPWEIATFTRFRRGVEAPSILIASPEEILASGAIGKGSGHDEWFAQVRTVLLLDAETSVAEQSMATGTVLRIIRDLKRSVESGDSLRTVMLADHRHGLEPAVRRNLPVDPVEHAVGDGLPKEGIGLVWRSEGPWFQHAFFDQAEMHLGDEPILAIPAWAEEFAPVRLLEQEALPVRDFIEGINRNRGQLDRHEDPAIRGRTGELSSVVECEFEFSELVGSLPLSILLVRDTRHEWMMALRKWLRYGEKGSFVQVVTTPYLLREYLADSVDYFFRDDTAGLRFTPRVMEGAPVRVGYELLQRMAARKLPLESVRWSLERAGYEEGPVDRRIRELLSDAFGIDVLEQGYLDVEYREEFSEDDEAFEDVRYYGLKDGVARSAEADWLEIYDVKAGGELRLGTVLRDHLYQKYLPGQLHAFDGKSYQVQGVDEEGRHLEVTHADDWENHIAYRTDLSAEVRPKRRLAAQRRRTAREGDWEVRANRLEADVTVSTSGFYTFRDALSLRSEDYRYVELTGERSVPDRTYDRGRVAELVFQSSANTADAEQFDASGVSFTLAVLLNESLPTFFPETDELVIAGSGYALPDQGSDLAQLMPRIDLTRSGEPGSGSEGSEAPDGECDETVRVIVVEDSHIDMGLVEAVYEEWEDILGIIYDYLAWLEEEKHHPGEDWTIDLGEGGSFLCYGRQSVPDELHLNELRRVLEAVLEPGHDSLHRRRSEGYEMDMDRGEDQKVGPNIDDQ